MSNSQDYAYDVFLSHNSADKPKVRWLADQLLAAGLRVWFDEWVIKPGDDIFLAIEHGLQSSRCLTLCISSRALASDWVALERSTALFRDPINKERRFIPLLLSQCEMPDTLRRYKYVDLTNPNAEALVELIATITNSQTNETFLAKHFASPITFVTDTFRLGDHEIELDFSIWNGDVNRILLTSISLQEYYSQETIYYSGYVGRYGLDLRVNTDLTGLSYKIDRDDALPFTVKLGIDVYGGGYIKIFGLTFKYSDASGKTKQAVSDAVYAVGEISKGFAVLTPNNFSILLDSANPASPTCRWVDPYPRRFYDNVVEIHAKHQQSTRA